MDLLIIWSKQQSRVVAEALHSWLPTVIPGIKPWISSKDIAKGREWFRELQDVLQQARVCIICVTAENVWSPWVYFETGAIVAKGPNVLVCPYLVGVSQSLLAGGPLGEFQCTIADERDTWELITSLNSYAIVASSDVSILKSNFNAGWPEFAAKVRPIANAKVSDVGGLLMANGGISEKEKENLSAEARAIILAASKDHFGLLMYTKTFGGTSFHSNGSELCPDQSPRTVARWKDAMDKLVDLKILEPRGDQGDSFALTAKGYDFADDLQ